MTTRSLFLSSSVGHAHRAASRAIAAALDPGWQHEELDYLAFLSRLERHVWTGLYHALLAYAPGVWRAWRQLTDRPGEPRFLRERVADAGARGLAAVFDRVQPRFVASTVSGAASLASAARRQLGARFVNALVVTHFRAHRHWARPGVDIAFVATDEARADLIRHGLAADRIVVAGTPLRPNIRPVDAHERRAIRASVGCGDDPMVVLSTGGTGVYRARTRVLDRLAGLGRPLDVLMFAERGTLETRGPVRIHRLGFRDDFGRLLAAADACVGKLGSLTAAEACAVGTPIVVYEPIPGPEEANAAHLVAIGAARWPRTLDELGRSVTRVLDGDGERLARAGRAMQRPDAARAIASQLQELAC
ncbi:MAG TPA: hypothetical protein VFQ53_13215 [Kofleriaceae bacterium]|nr:hypothetical protein [Kofleriaceae bacterium]